MSRTTLLCLAMTVVLFQRSPAAEPVSAERLDQLVAQLGSTKFTEREAATKELDTLGAPALDALKQAAKSGDAETRKRATELVARIERRLETDRLLAPSKVHLVCKDTPVAEAVADLAKQSGQRLVLGVEADKLGGRKVTLDTGATTFWQALNQLCRAGRLTEADSLRLGLQADEGRRPPLPRPVFGQIVLLDGTPPNLSTHHAGAARLRALAPETTVLGHTHKAGEILFALGFSLEVKTPLEKVDGVRIEKAVDDRGQELTPIIEAAPEPGVNQPTFIGNTKGRPTGIVSIGDVQVAVKLKTGTQASKQMKELRGVLTAQVRTPPEPLLTVDDILKAAGKSFDIKDGGRLTIVEVEKKEKGEVQVHVELQAPKERGPFKGNTVFILPGAAVSDIFGAGASIKLVDAKGTDFPTPPVPGARIFKADNNGITHDQTLSFLPKDGQAEAAKLVFLATRRVVVEIPFTLKDVPLP